ncbi:hypothetical protein [Plantactinospora endophytica]|uniref:DUF1573 domain-containing protein n=1 Tax=Plantactinospora endophytica TaxID=673535 RepID=A0ABQ4EAL5_9ACTN|nr:hypothetical protein [Plantactinospora endophytica]GIG91782.1 hypothetical protein Pen02_67180 [Plantactinospora endophytica]
MNSTIAGRRRAGAIAVTVGMALGALAPAAASAAPADRPANTRLGISATDLAYGPLEADGWRRGTTTVTIINPTRKTIQYPMITFLNNGADHAEHAIWSWDCPIGHGRPDREVCITNPLAPGEGRRIVFPFITETGGDTRTATVRVDAGADVEGTVLPKTGQSTWFKVTPGF